MHKEVGNNWVAAKELGMGQLEPFGEYEGQCIGVKGRIDGMAIEKWVATLEEYYDHPAHVVLAGPERIKSVAIVSGGAHSLLPQVAAQGIDCLVTGSFDEPVWWMAQEEKRHFIALGHFNTEKIGPRALARHLEEHLPIEVLFIEETNPF
jgi:putative NIF3 family GTP cyclohydrolase 1 type 2